MGLPTIGTDIRGNRQVIDDGVTGMLVQVRNPAALAGGLRSMLQRRNTWPQMSAAARARATKEFDQSLQIERTLAAYRAG